MRKPKSLYEHGRSVHLLKLKVSSTTIPYLSSILDWYYLCQTSNYRQQILMIMKHLWLVLINQLSFKCNSSSLYSFTLLSAHPSPTRPEGTIFEVNTHDVRESVLVQVGDVVTISFPRRRPILKGAVIERVRKDVDWKEVVLSYQKEIQQAKLLSLNSMHRLSLSSSPPLYLIPTSPSPPPSFLCLLLSLYI